MRRTIDPERQLKKAIRREVRKIAKKDGTTAALAYITECKERYYTAKVGRGR